jgi:hypothetical protein
MSAEIKERRRGAWLGSSDRRRDAEGGRQGERGTIDQGGFGYQRAFTSLTSRVREDLASPKSIEVFGA